jgi:hypothetical protein
MLHHLKSSSTFYNALRDKAREWLRLPETKFENAWSKVDAAFDKAWLSMTSSFNIDTWLIQCVEEVFPDLKRKRKDVERLFFEVRGQSDFGPHLVSKEMPWASAVGGKVTIIGVSLSERLGMCYRLRDSAGNLFQIEKFD